MKKLTVLVLMFITFFCNAQERKSFAVSYGLGSGTIGSFGKSFSGYYQTQKSVNILGLNYWHEISKNLYFETGMQFIRYDYVSKSVNPNDLSFNNTLNIISVPFKLRFEAGNYIFFNGGLTADLNKRKYSSMGIIGAGIGIGLQVKIVNQISLYVNPQAYIHGVIPNGSLFAESNITFGAAYRIK